jgi:hypothetical protein
MVVLLALLVPEEQAVNETATAATSAMPAT